MKIKKEEMPIMMQAPGLIARSLQDWGGFDVNYNEFSKGTDFTPVLKGLPGDKCHCPHWGYIIEGKFRFIYSDGTEETYEAGDLYYAPAGHTAIVEEDVKLLDFSPHKEHQELMLHVTEVMSKVS